MYFFFEKSSANTVGFGKVIKEEDVPKYVKTEGFLYTWEDLVKNMLSTVKNINVEIELDSDRSISYIYSDEILSNEDIDVIADHDPSVFTLWFEKRKEYESYGGNSIRIYATIHILVCVDDKNFYKLKEYFSNKKGVYIRDP